MKLFWYHIKCIDQIKIWMVSIIIWFLTRIWYLILFVCIFCLLVVFLFSSCRSSILFVKFIHLCLFFLVSSLFVLSQKWGVLNMGQRFLFLKEERVGMSGAWHRVAGFTPYGWGQVLKSLNSINFESYFFLILKLH